MVLLLKVTGLNYYLIIEEKFYLTPEVREQVLYFDSKEALRKYRNEFNMNKNSLKRIKGTGEACMVDGQLCPGKRMRI